VAILVALFIAVPILELWVILQVGGLIGVVPTLVLLLSVSLLGALLLRHQGRGAWQAFSAALAGRRFPGREVADGLMITLGGALLLTPGFITDAVGLLLLLPPTRAVARRVLRAYVRRRFLLVGLGGMTGDQRSGPAPRRDYDFDATAEEVDEDDRRLDK
jgi:UPF0716 protein FxsA